MKHILVMAGGSGTRFWPKSRVQRPKQLLQLWDDKTLLEHTLDRFPELCRSGQVTIVTTAALENKTRDIITRAHPQVEVLGEPQARNTLACILWGVLEVERRHKKDDLSKVTVVVLPADHYIGDTKQFLLSINTACDLALKEQSAFVTLGIKPNRPETGFGYLEVEDSRSASTRLKRFVEKPALQQAKDYIASGDFFWNAGMFVFTVEAALNAFRKIIPEALDLFQNSKLSIKDIYATLPEVFCTSFDYAIMEKCAAHNIPVFCVPTDCGWNDVGSFTALEDIGCATQGDVFQLKSSGNIVQTDHGVVALVGVQDLIVVRDGDVTLVCAKNEAQNIKAILDQVKAQHPNLA